MLDCDGLYPQTIPKMQNSPVDTPVGAYGAQKLVGAATEENFDEALYLKHNPDVAAAVANGDFASGRAHFDSHGRFEHRPLRRVPVDLSLKISKLDRIAEILRGDMPMIAQEGYFDFLTPDLRAAFNIVDTDNVSSNEYDGSVLSLIEKHRDGLILDCGAGNRSTYYSNVVNFEIVAYPSTDVRGVGEVLPFKDNSFDAVVSIAVLEHVKDPWQCAKEILRVLKPGGDLMCCVPLLQPVHGYPHHYYNMTGQGLANLFGDQIDILRHEVPDSTLPIWSLQWILSSWSRGLNGKARDDFMNLRVADLLQRPETYLNEPFVRDLDHEKNMELASATVIHATKR